MKKLTKEILQDRSNNIHASQYIILGEYVDNKTKILIKHLTCGNETEQIPRNHLMGKGCAKCFRPEKSSKEKLQKKSDLKHNGTYEILGEYINNETKISIRHLTCGTLFETIPNNHLKGTGCCSKCFLTIKKTKEQFQEESNIIHNNEYKILGEYINCDTKIEIRHLICGGIFEQTPDKHLHNNKCSICYKKHKLSKEILQERSDKKYNSEYTILGEYTNNQTTILIRHNICGSEYKQTPNNHIRERICYYCRGLQTLGEKVIDNYLKYKNIKFEFNKSLLDCKYIKKLRFDFYLPDYNICIEFDGEQHFRPVSKFGGEDRFILNRKRDETKDEWCKNNGIELIRIPYSESSIINKLNSIFNI